MKKPDTQNFKFFGAKPPHSFFRKPGSYLLVFLSLWISLFATPTQAQDESPLEWTAREISQSTGTILRSITWGGPAGQELFVAVGQNMVLTSPDGIIWTPRNAGVNNNWTSVTWGGPVGAELFVAVSNSFSSTVVITSPDGITWIPQDSPDAATWSSVTWGGPAGNEVFVAVGRNGFLKQAMTSPDGINWTTRNTPENYWSSVTWGGPAGQKLFVAVSDFATSDVMTSPDGITWNLRLSPRGFNWPSVTWGGPAGQELFVAVSNIGSGNRVMTSPDGITWTTRTSASDNNWSSVTWGGPAGRELFVAVAKSGTGNRVMTSPDGITWTSGASADLSWSSVAWGGSASRGSFVAVAEQPLNLSDISYQAMTGVYPGPPLAVDPIAILTNTTAKVSASLGDPGDLVVSEKGLIFIDTLISQNPLLETSGIEKIVDASTATGNFEGSLSGLSPNKVYVVKGYAKTSDGQVFYSKPTFFSTNTAPSFTHQLTDGILNLSVVENTSAVLDILVSDPDQGQTLSFILQGPDAGLFEFNPTTKKLSFKTAPDFEDPKDQNKDNSYELVLKATDNSDSPKTSQLALRVTVTNEAEKPLIQNLSFPDLGVSGAKLTATIIHNGGGGAVTALGFVLSPMSVNPDSQLEGLGVTILNSGVSIGEFSQIVSELESKTVYAVRAFARNAEGIVYTLPGSLTTGDAATSGPVISYPAIPVFKIGTELSALIPQSIGSTVPAGPYRKTETLAGNGTTGNVNGTGAAARFNRPFGMVADQQGNVYIADMDNHTIRKMTPAGEVTTLAGTAGQANFTDGIGAAARFRNPTALALDPTDKFLYIADRLNHRIRMLDLTTGAVTTLAGTGTDAFRDNLADGSLASFNQPSALAVDPQGNLVVTDQFNHRIRKVLNNSALPAGGNALNFDGVNDLVEISNESRFDFTTAMTVEAWVRVSSFTRAWQTIVAKGDNSWRLSRENNGNRLEFAVSTAGGVRVVTGNLNVNDGKWHHVAATFDGTNIRLFVDGVLENTTSFASTTISNSDFNVSIGQNLQQTNRLWHGSIDEVRIWNQALGENAIRQSMLAPVNGNESGLIAAYDFNQGVADGSNTVITSLTNKTATSGLNGELKNFGLSSTTSNWVPGRTLATWRVETLAGNGTAGLVDGPALTTARMNQPTGIAVGPNGEIYFSSKEEDRVRKLTDGVISTVAGGGANGIDGLGSSANFNDPYHLEIDRAGNLFVADANNHRIRRITPTGEVSSLAGSMISASGNEDGIGNSARFNNPGGLALDDLGNLYVAEFGAHRIRKINLNGYELTGNLPKGILFDPVTGGFSGTPTEISLSTHYRSDFESGVAFVGENGTITPTLVDNAAIAGGVLRFTPPVNNQKGGITIPASGKNAGELGVDFQMITGKTTGGADGLSYSFAADANAAATSPNAEIGTGSGLSLSFNTFSGGIRLYYGAGKAQTNTVGQTGLIAYSADNSWRGKSVEVSLRVFKDSASVYVGDVLVFNKIPLPKAYSDADKSTWKHAFRSRTGGFNDIHAIDGLAIGHGYGETQLQVRAQNDKGSYLTDTKLRVGSVPELTTQKVEKITSNSAESGLIRSFDGNFPVTKQGLIWGTSAGLTLENALGKTEQDISQNTLVSAITGLEDLTTYYVRAYAENSLGVGYGEEFVFTTLLSPPIIRYAKSSYTVGKDQAVNLSVTNSGGRVPEGFLGVTTLAGSTMGFADGQGTAAQFNAPVGVALDALGNVYVADQNNNRIRKITPQGLVSTLAGSAAGFADGQGAAAQFSSPTGVALDAFGNVYVADFLNNRIRKITPAGGVSTVAGGIFFGDTDGPGSAARLQNPASVVSDALGNLYVADRTIHRIRKITPEGFVSTLAGSTSGFADGQGTAAQFRSPQGVALDALGNVYVSDQINHRIRKITPEGLVSTLAGSTVGFADGQGPAAQFTQPHGVALDALGNVYVGDNLNHRIRKITPEGLVSTLAGSTQGIANGQVTAARFNTPRGIALDALGNVYVADWANHRIRKISLGWSISPSLPAGLTLGPDGIIIGTPTALSPEIEYTLTAVNSAGSGSFTFKLGVFEIGLSDLTVSAGTLTPAFNPDVLSYSVRADAALSEIAFTATEFLTGSTIEWKSGEGSFSTLASGTASPSITLVEGANLISIKVTSADQRSSKTYTLNVLKPVTPPAISYTPSLILPLNQVMTPLSPNNTGGAVPPGNQIIVSTLAGSTSGFANGIGSAAQFQGPISLAVDASGNVYVADVENHRIRKITPEGGVSTLAGSSDGFADGQGTAAQFNQPGGVSLDILGNVYVADAGNSRIRKITPAGQVSTLAGSSARGGAQDGQGTAAQFRRPVGVALDASGNVYVADQNNHRIRKITPAGVVSTLAGSTAGFSDGQGTAAQFNTPFGVSLDTLGNVYVADFLNNRIRKITPEGLVSTLAGSTRGFSDGQGTAAQFSSPTGVALDALGNVYVADVGNHRIRKITPAGGVSTLAGSTTGFADGFGSAARFSSPRDIALDFIGNIYVADQSNHRIRKIEMPTWSVSPALPAGLILNADGSISGTPTALSSATDYVVTGKNAGGSSSYTIRIQVTSGPTDGLQNLQLSEGSLSPTFSGSIFNYQVQVPATVESIRFTPTAVNTTAVLTLNSAAVNNAAQSGAYPLNFGPNTFTWVVTETNQTIKTYTVVVTRALAPPTNEILWEGTGSRNWTSDGNWKGNSRPASGADVKFSPTAANDLEVDDDLIAGTIDFNGSDKKVVLANNSLTASGFAGRSASNFVQITGQGRLKILIKTSVKALYPIGNQNYTPVSITNKAGQSFEFSVGLATEVLDQGTTGNAIPNARIKRTWDISNEANSVGGSGIDLEFSWTAAEDTGVKSPALYHYENGAWTKLDASKTTVDLSSRILIYKAYIGSLSPFAIYDELPTETQLTISTPTLTKTKVYDGTTTAAITAGTLSGVANGDVVTVSAVATYDNALAGTGKTIRVVYTLGGADAGKYLKPIDEEYTDGEITKVQLTATAATVMTGKVYDGLTKASVTAGTLSGVLDGETVSLIATAAYDNDTAGTSKTITVSYSLNGPDAGNYLPPVDEEVLGEITKAPLLVKVKADAKFIGQTDPTAFNGATLTGFVNGESEEDLGGSLTIARCNPAENAVGEFIAVLRGSGFTSDNYEITYVDGDFSILPADALLVKLESAKTTYSEDPVYTISSAGYFSSTNEQLVDLISSATITGISVGVLDSFESSSFTLEVLNPQSSTSGTLKAGSYTIGFKDEQLSSNVTSLKVLGTLEVTPSALQAPLAAGDSKEYDGTRDMVGVRVEPSGVLTDDVVTLSFGSALYSGASAGSQNYRVDGITLSGADAANYTIDAQLTGQGQISAKALTFNGTTVTKVKAYDGTTAAAVSVGWVSGIANQDVVNVKPSAQYVDKFAGKNKTINLSYALEGPASGNYSAPDGETFTDGEITRKALTVTDPTLVLRKAYDGTRNAAVEAGSLLGLVEGDNVTVTASALYDNASVGTGKTITVNYSLSGSDTLNYQTTLQEFVTNQGEIFATGPIQLLITEPQLTLSKDYDGTASAAVQAGNLIGLADGADVKVTAAAVYENAQSGTGKKITVSYELTGTDAADYIAPPVYVVTNGEIKKIQLTITEPTVITSKVFDGNTTAAIVSLGTVTGVLVGEDVTVKGNAAYEDSQVGMDKTITVSYTLDGAAIANYLAPESDIITTGEIKEAINDLDGDGIPDEDDPDTDGDGIDNITEQQVPSATGTGLGDGNGDGIPDYLQAHVVSFKSAELGIRNTEQFVTLATPVGPYIFSEVTSEKRPAGLARSVSSRLPFGVTKFTLSGLQSGQAITLSVFVDKTSALTGYFKQATGQTVWTNLMSGGISTLANKRSLSFSISDNGIYDLDPSNGVLKDPGLITTYPMISSNGGEEEAEISIKENQLVVTTVEASDEESSTFTFGIEMGADELLFEIDENTGELRFKTAPDFENPSDADQDNVYELIVNAFASNGTIDRQQLFITVEDDNDSPSFISPEGGIAYLRGLVEFEDEASASSTDENPGDDMLGVGFNGENTLDLLSLFEDQDQVGGNSMTGIAISENIADADTEGVWEYSTDLDAQVWYPIGAVSRDNALLLDLEAFIRFVPVPNYFGSPIGLKVHPVDGSGATVAPEINSAGGTAWTFDTEKKYYTDLNEDAINSSVGVNAIEVNIIVEGTEDLPEAKEVATTGTAIVEEKLTGTYTYQDVDGDSESGTELAWFQSATGLEDSWTQISGAIGTEFTLTLSEVNQYIRFGVRPNDGKAFGEWSYSEKVGPVIPKGKIQLSISAPEVTLSKEYDRTNTALSTAGLLSGLIPGDEVTVTATATYADANAGTDKTITVTYTLSGRDAEKYLAPTDDQFTGIITAKALTITADDKQKIYGEENPTLTFSYAGLVNGDTKVATEPSINTTATQTSNVGTYPITLTGGSDDNYDIELKAGTLTVGKAKVTITADDKQRAFGEANPTLTFSYAGLVNGDTKVATEPSINTTATQTSNVGTYPITLTGGSDDNYDIELKAGTLTVGKAKVTITADDKQRAFGEANPTLTFSYAGLLNGDTKVATEPSINTTATQTSNVGTYPITLTGGSDDNYDIELVNGTLTVIQSEATLAITSFTLVNARTNKDILTLTNGLQISQDQVQGLLLNIRANTNPSVVGSVYFTISGPVNRTVTENVVPYALFGDNNGNYNGRTLPVGNYTLTAMAYSISRRRGTAGKVSSIQFSIVPTPVSVTGITTTPSTSSLIVGKTLQVTATVLPSNATNKAVVWATSDPAVASVSERGLVTALSPGVTTVTATTLDGNFSSTTLVTVSQSNPSLSIESFTLVNARTNKDILTLTNGLQISQDQVQGLLLNIRANTNPSVVGSVYFTISGPVNRTVTENVVPYALFGDNNGNYNGRTLPAGNYTLTAMAYSRSKRRGTAGPLSTITFSIVKNAFRTANEEGNTDEPAGEVMEKESPNTKEVQAPHTLKAFPNPIQDGRVSIVDSRFNEGMVKYVLYSINGVKLTDGQAEIGEGKTILLDFSGPVTQAGMYILILDYDKYLAPQRVHLIFE
ncbi:YDG domain-containing protein [Aquiflexum sp. LQ15W]|uniref:YDG domain-containing protein n=1 Tax=Cognataquiflexum nitidum TaxID=2922272 RepID=UPI001F13A8DA|nr:YDG domain-containing protein [Cognataquiflexum nitidum]MCH6198943.1 YDG domain-containing protein [Cognataquiflexum nitidum]